MAKPPLFPGLKVLARFFSPTWWRHVIIFSWQFRRRLILPSALFFVTAIIGTFVVNVMQELNQKPGQEAINANELLPKLLIGLAGLSLSGILFIVALSLLLVALMTFTRAFLIFPLPANAAATATKDYGKAIEQAFVSAAADLKTHKGYLTKVLLLEALICLPLILLFCASFLFSGILLTPDTPSLTIPPEIRALSLPAQIVTAIVFVILSNYSVVSVAVACMFDRTIGKAISFSLLLFLTTAPLMTAMTAATTVLSTILTTPYVAISFFNAGAAWATPGNIYQQLAWESWQVLAGFLVYPVSTAMLFEVARDAVVSNETKFPMETLSETQPETPPDRQLEKPPNMEFPLETSLNMQADLQPDIPKDIPNDIPKDIPNDIPKDIPNNIPNNIQ